VRPRFVLVCCLSIWAALPSLAKSKPFHFPKPEAAGRAPELSSGDAWLNVDRALTLRGDLKGRVVLLDFWTYRCIDCMHALPELKAMEKRFAQEPFQVIGVHSGKFDGEKDFGRIQESIGRYGIEHPVVVDSDFEIWNRYGVSAWPTTVLIDAEGNIVSKTAGEPNREALEKQIAELLESAKSRKVAAQEPLMLTSVKKESSGPLYYPGKVAALDGDRVAVADSGHHRLRWLNPETGALSPFNIRRPAEAAAPAAPRQKTHLGDSTVSSGKHEVVLSILLPEGHTFTDGAPVRVSLSVPEGNGISVGKVASEISGPLLQARADVELLEEANGELAFDVALYYCGSDKALCLVDRRRLLYGLKSAGLDSPHRIEVSYRAPPPPTQ
jgi:thiol-disulfide isomerase/thioredoxin